MPSMQPDDDGSTAIFMRMEEDHGEAGIVRTEYEESSGAARMKPNVSCSCNGLTDIKQWYIGIITPHFHTNEAQEALGLVPDMKMFPSPPHAKNDDSALPSPNMALVASPRPERLIAASRMIRNSSREFNPETMFGAKTTIEKKSQDASCYARFCAPMTKGSIRTCSATLTATALGAGALAIPYAFSLVGLGLGLLTLTLAAFVSALSVQILMVAARYTDSKSYAAVFHLAIGKRFAPLIIDLIIVCNGLGAIICILIFEGDFLPSVLPSSVVPSRAVAVIAAALLAWPLTLPSEISALRYVSILVPIVLLATVGVAMWEAPKRYLELCEANGGNGGIIWWDFDLRRWLQAFSIMVNAFMNQANAVPVGNSLDKPSIARIVKVSVNATLSIWCLLAPLGIAGYLSWGPATMGDFIMNYPQNSKEIWLCRACLSLTVYLVLPVALLPTSKSLAQLVVLAFRNESADATRARSVSVDNNVVGHWLHKICATLLLTCCTVVASQVSNVAMVVGILGGLFASALMFLFPAIIFYILLWPNMPRLFRWPVLIVTFTFGMAGWASVLSSYVI
eukprot:TRINITY_DN879_c0_g1_i1.p1 TRINITY_DN879_c0_g1~~TRINITY_DN879_c0_g1_i1.p1  ORF type:complete len:566 (-),score=59.65 TRINITY_DN879_c0_g1_i1:240-1937(-)